MNRKPLLAAAACLLALAISLQCAGAPLPDADVKRVLHALTPYANSAPREGVLREIARENDARFIAPLVDLMRFARGRDELLLIADTLQRLAGPGAPARDWGAMVEWVGERPHLQPPPGYAGWKGVLHSPIDARFVDFLREGVKATVRIEEVQWGEWRRQHPDTSVLDIKTGHQRPYTAGAAWSRTALPAGKSSCITATQSGACRCPRPGAQVWRTISGSNAREPRSGTIPASCRS